MKTTARPTQRPSGSLGTLQAKRNYLAEIKTEVARRPLATILYGVPGIGKTSAGAYSRDPIFLTTKDEDGITTLKNFGRVPKTVPQLPPAATWADTLGMLDWLADADHAYHTLVADALGGFERQCHEEVVRRDYRGEWGDKGFGSYQKGYETALTDWRIFLNALDRLRDEKGMAILLLGHSKIKNFRNPSGLDFDRYVCDVNPKTWELTHKWADQVLFANYVTVVDKDGKAQGGQQRVLYTEYHPAFDAKNRSGLPTEIDMGNSGQEAWGNLAGALKTCLGKDGA